MAHADEKKIGPIPQPERPGAKVHGKDERPHARMPSGTRKEVTVLSIDARGWGRRKLDHDESRRLLENLGQYVKQRFDPGRGRRKRSAAEAEGVAMAATSGPGGSGTLGGENEGCEVVLTEFRECLDEQGEMHMCRCELFECTNGTSYWVCAPIE